jgi:dienelactone hydrolase
MTLKEERANPKIRIDSIELEGTLRIPRGAKGIVLFAHGSGSGRLSPRNRFVAEVLDRSGVGTLLFDLLTEGEDQQYENRFNIDLLAQRLVKVTSWLAGRPESQGKRLGYFGASTGAAAALQASAGPTRIWAIVSRGGRPDLARESLPQVRTPTLLIVGELDNGVIMLNEAALKSLRCEKRLAIVPGASHLFEETGALEEVARLAAEWFTKYLA